MYLETGRVRLREIEVQDEDLLFELDSDPEVMRFLSDGVPSTREEVRAGLQRCLALKIKHQGRFGVWIAMEKSSGKFMGWFLFRPAYKDPENVRRIELGYRLKKAFWGHGYATEVSKALINKGFSELGVDEVFAVTMKNNLASQTVMQKCGLQFVREFMDSEGNPLIPEVEFSLRKT